MAADMEHGSMETDAAPRFDYLLNQLRREHKRALAAHQQGPRLEVEEEEFGRLRSHQIEEEGGDGEVEEDLDEACRARHRAGRLCFHLDEVAQANTERSVRGRNGGTALLSPTSPTGTLNSSLSIRSKGPAAARLSLRDEWKFGRVSVGEDIHYGSEGSYGKSNRSSEGRAVAAEQPPPPSRSCVLSPTSSYRMYWNISGMIFILYDVFSIPLLVFDIPSNFASTTMEVVTLLFWTVDMVLSFFVGFYVRGEPVMEQPAVALHHLRTWFLLDVVVVGPDWFSIIVGSTSSTSQRVNRLIRVARTIRVLRLVRITKIRRGLTYLYDLIDDDFSFILAELAKMMMLIVTINHIAACGWFLCAKIARDQNMNNWIDWREQDEYSTSSPFYQYATSLHWCLTQFTPASMDVVARNIIERCYSICVLLVAMVAFSSIVGTITTSITSIRTINSDVQKGFWMLRRYLKQVGITNDLKNRMIKFIEYKVNNQDRMIPRSKVTFLNCLSDQLSSELAFESYARPIKLHKVFEYMIDTLPSLAFQICGDALVAKSFADSDLIFAVSEEATRSFVLKKGSVTYVHQNGGGSIKPTVQPDEWIAEAAIWMPWRYRGCCSVLSPSEVIIIEVQKFIQLVSAHPQTWVYAARYAEGFVYYVTAIASQLSDVLRDPGLQDAIADSIPARRQPAKRSWRK